MENIDLIISTAALAGIAWLIYKSKSKRSTLLSDRNIVIDTSALMDGRIIELAKTGFLQGRIIISEFVLQELQHLADSKDHQKRRRARHGLDLIKELKESEAAKDFKISREKFTNIPEVDHKLVELAKLYDADLYTTDFNLNKVAKVEGVRVLNVNELAHLLRPQVLPGETTEIKIVQRGHDKGQGVGYLDDGTMVVVDNAQGKVGKKVKVKFERSLQTLAGKMLFAKTINNSRRGSKKTQRK